MKSIITCLEIKLLTKYLYFKWENGTRFFGESCRLVLSFNFFLTIFLRKITQILQILFAFRCQLNGDKQIKKSNHFRKVKANETTIVRMVRFSSKKKNCVRIRMQPEILSSVADPHHFDANPDQAFHFDADPDQAFNFDPDPDPTFHSDADPDLTFKLMLQNDPLRFQPFSL